ncbi:MAG: acyltransferase [Pseudomonadota bacterium]
MGRSGISPALSLYLDTLRVLAAFAVLLDHLLLRRFHGLEADLNRNFDVGGDGVMVFFAVSGFVIAHAAQDRSASAFAFARLTRLWSVFIPAVILTYLLDQWGSSINPKTYDGSFYNPLPFAGYLFYGFTLSNEWVFGAQRIGSNGPLWSLSYEAAYYALFAIGFYATGLRRWVLLGVGAWLAGPMVLLYLPCWLFGVGAYWILKYPPRLNQSVLWLGALGPAAIYIGVFMTGHPSAGPGIAPNLGRHAHLVWDLAVAGLTAMSILSVGILSKNARVPNIPALRYLAGASFSLYVCHFPLLQITSALTDWSGLGFIAAGATTAIIGSLAFAAIFERPLPKIRSYLRMISSRWAMNRVTP